MSQKIVGIRFQKAGKVYHFDSSSCPDLKIGDYAMVDTSRGSQLGEVIMIIEEPPKSLEGEWKKIKRKATPQDLVIRQIWEKKELEAVQNCRQKVMEIGLKGIKIISAEYSFEGDRLTILYNSEGDEKLDLKKLRMSLKRNYPKIRIELRQVGPRDVAKCLGGLGACGMEIRCCSMFLTEFSPISIKMAKEQNISLTPSEITGMCGRLRCCLVYEYEQYLEARKTLPKRGKRVITPMGEGRVADISPVTMSIIVEFDKGTQKEFQLEQIQLKD